MKMNMLLIDIHNIRNSTIPTIVLLCVCIIYIKTFTRLLTITDELSIAWRMFTKCLFIVNRHFWQVIELYILQKILAVTYWKPHILLQIFQGLNFAISWTGEHLETPDMLLGFQKDQNKKHFSAQGNSALFLC